MLEIYPLTIDFIHYMSTHSLLVQTVLHVLPADGKAVNRAVILSVPLEAIYHNYYEGNKYV